MPDLATSEAPAAAPRAHGSFDDEVGVRFREILTGYVRGAGRPLRGEDDAGHFSLDVTLEIPRLRDFLAADRHVARISEGTVAWKPFVPRTPIEAGEVVLFRSERGNRRRKFHDFRFDFPSGSGYDIRFEGTKVLKSDGPSDAATDLTTMSAQLIADGRPIARGVLNVHIDALLRQLDWLEPTRVSSDADASAARAAFFDFFNRETREVYPDIPTILEDERRLTNAERRALRVCLPIMLPRPLPANGPTVEEVIAQLERFIAVARADQLNDIRNTLRAAALALPLLDDILNLRRIAAIELRRLSRSPLRDVLEQLHTLAVFPFYSHPKADTVVGYQRPEHVHRAPTPSLPVAADPPDRTFDVVIAGSGPAGSVLAHRLTAQGRSVLVLEEGAYVPERDIDADELLWTARLYKRSALQRANEPRSVLDTQIPGFQVLQGGCVGGGGVVNNAVCFRLEPRRLRDWRAIGFPIDADTLDAGYDAIAHDLSIGPVSATARKLNPAFRYLEGTIGPVRVPDAGAPTSPGLWECLVNLEPAAGADHGCLGLGLCNVGCGSERKRNALQVHLREAAAGDLTIVPFARATQFETNASGTRVDGLVVTLRDGRSVTVRGREYVLACGPIGSSEVLLRTPGLQSRIRGGQLPVGRRFSANVGSPLFAVIDEEVNRSPGLQIGHAYVPPDGNAGFVLETWYNPPAGNAAAMPGYMDVHHERMKLFARTVSAAPLVGTRPVGRIGLRDGHVTIDLPIEAPEIDAIAAGLGLLAGAFLAGGAHACIGAVGWGFEMREPDDVGRFRDELHALARNPRHRHLLRFGTGHPQGGNAMSEDPAIGVVGAGFRVRGVDNLRVCDGSIFPDSARVNPQWTILALADRCAEAMRL
jgi:choline dehydrogenase-like flavoprotein